jgi:hypothetical protein
VSERKTAARKRLRAAAASVRRHQKRAAAFTARATKCRGCLYLYCHPCGRSHCAQHCRSADPGAVRQ